MNAIVAGSIIAALGEGSIYVFEQVYLGKKTVADIDWVKKLFESEFSGRLIDVVRTAAEKTTKDADLKDVAKIVLDVFKSIFGAAKQAKALPTTPEPQGE
ncbi:MAG: hypothetical protein Q4B42_08280 [Oscillospiraceae bacterium]|nr:hypothetical protein [Oscillospiraceae bacterium]